MPFRALRWHSPARVLLSSAETKDKALNIETAGEDYYRRLAEKAPEPVAKIFRELASDDREHQFTVDEAFRAGAKAMPGMAFTSPARLDPRPHSPALHNPHPCE